MYIVSGVGFFRTGALVFLILYDTHFRHAVTEVWRPLGYPVAEKPDRKPGDDLCCHFQETVAPALVTTVRMRPLLTAVLLMNNKELDFRILQYKENQLGIKAYVRLDGLVNIKHFQHAGNTLTE